MPVRIRRLVGPIAVAMLALPAAALAQGPCADRRPAERITLSLPLPVDLPEGNYAAQIGDDLDAVLAELRDNPHLNLPQSLPHLFDGLELLLSARRTNLVVRVPTPVCQSCLPARSKQNTPDLPKKMYSRSPSLTGVLDA